MSNIHTAIKRSFEERRSNQDKLQGLYEEAEGRELTADEAATEANVLEDLRKLADKELELVGLADKESRSMQEVTR